MRSLRATKLAAPCLAALVAASLIGATPGYTTLGFVLGQAYRDARVFNNFTDVSANDNTTPDPSWPGAVGAPLAIWKACTEWSSEKHDLTGSGDPHQPGDLGSGAANFDVSWQGLASSVGGPGDRVHSEISGSNPGVFAYTEGPLGGPGASGWRIRYYAAWTWNDGPDATLPAGHHDLQGVAAHEYGHALGLGHSTAASATMYAFVQGNGVPARSLDPDDVAGVQWIYQPLDTTLKPHLSGVSVNGSQITLTGTNFAATDNQIWFTRATPAASGAPVTVGPLASNGTVLTATIPPEAGAGDVMVKKGGAAGHKGLSNALAFDPQACAGVVAYCTSGLSSNFCSPVIASTGIPSASAASGFTIRCTGLEGQRSALLFYGTSGRAASLWALGSSSWLCVKAPTQRTVAQTTGGTAGACNGSVAIDWLAFLAANPSALGNPLQAGLVVDAQCWYRDPAAVKTTNLSGGLEFTTCP